MSVFIEEIPNRDQLRKTVESGDLKEVNTLLTLMQSAFERGGLNDRELNKAFLAFDSFIESLADPLDQWVDQMPGSYVARLARAKFLVAKAGFYRGYTRSREVSQENWDVVHACYERASEDLVLLR
jgi:hypothetical protein